MGGLTQYAIKESKESCLVVVTEAIERKICNKKVICDNCIL